MPVGVDTVNREPMTQTVPIIGRLVSLQNGEVAARTGGPVAELKAEVGDHVNKGDIIALLDQARLQARLDMVKTELQEMEARQASAEANEKLADQELNRLAETSVIQQLLLNRYTTIAYKN